MDGRTCYVPEGPGLDIVRASNNSPAVCHLKAFSEKSKLVFLKSAILKCVCTILTWSARKDPEQGWCSSFSSLVLFLPHFQSGCKCWCNACLPRSHVCWLVGFSVPGEQCHENHPWGGRWWPRWCSAEALSSHECAWHSAQPAPQQAGEPSHWSRGRHCHGHQAEDHWDFTGKA